MGTFYIWVHGKVEFHDLQNDIYAWYEIGKVSGKTQEYFSGELIYKGNKISDISGNYCGYLDFDEKRYFDVREVDAVFHEIIDEPVSLPSDSMKR